MLDIFTYLLPHIGKTILKQGNRSDNQEHDDGDGGSQAILNAAPTAFERQLIDITDQDIRMTCLGGRTDNWRTALDKQIDQVEIIEVEHKGSDQQWANRHQKQGQGNAPEGSPAGGSVDHGGFIDIGW